MRPDSPGHRLGGGRDRPPQPREITVAGMIRKLLISGVATKLVQEARKPENQAKIKKAVADFQRKRSQGRRP